MNRFRKGLVIVLVLLTCISLGWFLNGFLKESRSIGIIGGADGPTAILVTGPGHHDNQTFYETLHIAASGIRNSFHSLYRGCGKKSTPKL